MISKIVVVVVVVVAFVAVEAMPKTDSAASQLRSMAASPNRSKRASFSVLPGRLRYEGVNQRRLVKTKVADFCRQLAGRTSRITFTSSLF
jgi:hypothetical protein